MTDSTDPAFAPEVANSDDAENWARKSEQRIKVAFESIAKVQTWEREQDRECAAMLQRQLNSILAAIPTLASFGVGMIMTRVHGDFHLGQVLVADGDAYIIDFEREPAAPIAERRAKTSSTP